MIILLSDASSLKSEKDLGSMINSNEIDSNLMTE